MPGQKAGLDTSSLSRRCEAEGCAKWPLYGNEVCVQFDSSRHAKNVKAPCACCQMPFRSCVLRTGTAGWVIQSRALRSVLYKVNLSVLQILFAIDVGENLRTGGNFAFCAGWTCSHVQQVQYREKQTALHTWGHGLDRDERYTPEAGSRTKALVCVRAWRTLSVCCTRNLGHPIKVRCFLFYCCRKVLSLRILVCLFQKPEYLTAYTARCLCRLLLAACG